MLKLKNILLVDDDEITNYINTDLIEDLGIAENISKAANGIEALEYLKKIVYEHNNNPVAFPEIILLDVNMPEMGGIGFLEHFEEMKNNLPVSTVVVMLSTSLLGGEMEEIMSHAGIVKGFIEKPLSKESLMDIYNTYINNRDLH
jgi:CheY-like chemotaxis protein